MSLKPAKTLFLILGTLSTPLFADTWSGAQGKIYSTGGTNVGVGTANIGSKLQVNGNVAIGYSNSASSPSNGLAVSGNVNVGGALPGSAPSSGVLAAATIVGNNVYPVTAFGADPSKTDNTLQFAAALTAASAAGGGVVAVPNGKFKILGTLNIPRGVTLRGTWNAPHDAELGLGTTLLAYSGKNQPTTSPFITMAADATLEGLTIYYPEQTNTYSPSSYPFTIACRTSLTDAGLSGGIGNFAILNVTLANSYRGIQVIEKHERHFLQGVNITALNLGVEIDYCTYIGIMEDVHVCNRFWWTAATMLPNAIEDLRQFTLHNMTGFRIKRTDWEQIRDSFVIWARKGMDFLPGTMGNPSALIVNSGVDHSDCALEIKGVWPQSGLEFANCQFVGYTLIQNDGTIPNGPVKMTNTNFLRSPDSWDPDYKDYLIVKQDHENLLLSNCSFSSYGAIRPWWALALQGGVTLVSNSEFRANLSGYGHVWVANNAKAVVTNNFARGNEWKFSAAVDTNLIQTNNIRLP